MANDLKRLLEARAAGLQAAGVDSNDAAQDSFTKALTEASAGAPNPGATMQSPLEVQLREGTNTTEQPVVEQAVVNAPVAAPPAPTPPAPPAAPTVYEKQLAATPSQLVVQEVVEEQQELREFKHLYAGAGTNMPDGTRIVFGGRPGHEGTFVTRDRTQIAFLQMLANTPGSQISEPANHHANDQFIMEQRQALADSRANSARDLDPAIVAARSKLQTIITQTGE